jgi:hypothetical protein
MGQLKRLLLNRSFISLAVTLGIIAVLVFVSTPVQALTISVSNTASAYHNSPYTFSVTINVENSDLLPIQHVDLQIYNAADPGSYTINYANLPIPAGASGTARGTSTGSFGTITASASSDANWGYASQTWGTTSFGYGIGYGYGYGSYIGPSTLTYTITWTSPASFPTGTYNIRVLAYGNSGTAFTHAGTYSFTLYAALVSQPPFSTGGPAAEPGVTFVNNLVDLRGIFTQSVIAKSADQNVS